MASGGLDSRGLTTIPYSWKKFCIDLNGKQEDILLTPFCIQFLLDKHARNVLQTLRDKKFSDIQILEKQQCLSLKYDTTAQDEGDVMHDLFEFLEEKVGKCQVKKVAVPKDKEYILHECDLLDSSGDVGIYHNRVERNIKIVGFDIEQVEKIVQWISDKLKSDSADNSSFNHRLSTTWVMYEELDAMGFFDDCDENIKGMRRNVYEKGEVCEMYGKKNDALYLDKELQKMCLNVKMVEIEILSSEGEVLHFPEGKAFVERKLLQENIKNILWNISQKQTKVYLQIKSKSDELNEKASKVIRSSVSSVCISNEMQQSEEYQKLRELHQMVICGSSCYATSDVLEKLKGLKQIKQRKKQREVEFPIDIWKVLLLKKKNAKDYVEKKLMGAGISCQFEVIVHNESENILRFAESRVDARRAYDLIEECLKCLQYSNTRNVASNAGWKELELRHKDKWIVDDLKGEEFTVCCTADIEGEVKDVVDKMMKERWVEFKVDSCKYGFVKEKLQGHLLEIAKANDVEISTDNCHLVSLTGKEVNQAKRDLEKLLQNIEICKVGNIHGVIDLILKENKIDRDLQIMLEENCDVFVQEELKEAQPHHLRDWVNLKRPFHICVLKGSATKTIADMIVLPTNDSYNPVEDGEQIFLDGAVEILKDISADVNIKRYGLGNCHIFKNTGNLKFQYIGCLCTTYNTTKGTTFSKAHLRKWIVKLLQEADRLGIQSVVIPIQLTNLVLTEVQMEEIAKALKEISSMSSIKSLHEVHVCVTEEEKNEEIMQIFQLELKDFLECDFHCLLPSRRNQIDEKDQKSPIQIEIVEGHIEMQKVDVVVNAVSHDLDLSKGVISRKILEIAGEDLQHELFEKSPMKIGDCVHSKSWNMQTCKAICHVALSDWTPCTDFSLRVVKLVMWQCLWHGHQNRFSSIAFPALGCGKQKYPPSSLATVMMECVEEFGFENPDTTLKTVKFVIFPDDKSVLQWFYVAQRKCSQSISSYPELPQRILEWRKSTQNGTVKIKTVTIDAGEDSRILRSCGCDVIFHFRPRKPDDGKEYLLNWNNECLVGTVLIDNLDLKKSCEEKLRGIWITASQSRWTSVAVCIRDLTQAGWNDVESQLQMVRDTFLREAEIKTNMYIQVIWVVTTEGEHQEVLGKVSELQKKRWDKKLWNTAMSIFYGSMSDWKITTPTYNRMKSEKLVALMLVGEKEQVELVRKKIEQLEKRLPETEQEHWKYTKPVGSYTEAIDLPKEVCRKLSMAHILEKDRVTLNMEPDMPFCFNLKKMRCGPKIEEMKYDLQRYSHQDAASGKNQEVKLFDDTEDDFSIFEYVTGVITNQETAVGETKQEICQVIRQSGCEVKVEEKSVFHIQGSLSQILKVNQQLTDIDRGKKRSSSDLTDFVIHIPMSEMHYNAFVFFGNKYPWYKKVANSMQHTEDALACTLSGNEAEMIEKEMKELLDNIKMMTLESIEIENKEADVSQVVKDVGESNPNVYLVFKENTIQLTSDNYSDLQRVKGLLQQKMSGKKNRRAGRRFALSQSEESNQKAPDTGDVYNRRKFAVDESSQRFSNYDNMNQFMPPEQVEIKTNEGLVVKIYTGSITYLEVDCIVNAANDQLMHGGGVAAAISQAAGYKFDEESKDYIAKNGPIPVGSCGVTSAGRLPYNYVIHTVGPRWGDYRNKNQCLDDLCESVEVTFREADRLRMRSIALPAISSGIFAVPRDQCIEQYHRAVMTFSRNFPFQNLQEIHFVDRDSSMVGAIQELFKQRRSSGYTPANQKAQLTDDDKLSSIHKKDQLNEQSSSTDSIINVSDGFLIKLHVGNIADAVTDVVVCPQDENCLSNGQIAKAIFGMTPDKFSRSQRKKKVGDILSQNLPGNSPWKMIIHAVTPRWTGESAKTPQNYEKTLNIMIQKILKTADDAKFSSIAIPLLGAGVGDYQTPMEICARNLCKAVKATHSELIKLKEIQLVLDDENAEKAYLDIFKEEGFQIIPKTVFKTGQSMSTKDWGKTIKGSNLSKEQENCCICMDLPTTPKRLQKCGHIFCKDCIEQYFEYKPACPSCGEFYGKVMGDQPPGYISMKKDYQRLEGFNDCRNCIIVTYTFFNGSQGPEHPNPGRQYKGIVRSGYVPNNERGRLVAKLLNVAFSRRLVFTIGHSRTTGQDGVITWNDIHHKTRPIGGPERFGYPDNTYLDRVLEELAAKGVTPESADDPLEYSEYSKFIKLYG